MPCSTCQHVRSTVAADGRPVLECRAYPPEIGDLREDGVTAAWPRVHLQDDCGLWLHRLTDDIKIVPPRE